MWAWHLLPSVLLHHLWRPLGFPPERWRHSHRDYLLLAAFLQDIDKRTTKRKSDKRTNHNDKLMTALFSFLFSFFSQRTQCLFPPYPGFQASCWTESGRKCDNLSQPWAGRSHGTSPEGLTNTRKRTHMTPCHSFTSITSIWKCCWSYMFQYQQRLTFLWCQNEFGWISPGRIKFVFLKIP